MSNAAYTTLLQRPEPATTKKLSILTLTRIFLLTQEHPNLLREITTPSLPTFIANCLRSFSDSKGGFSDSLLSSVLWAFGELLPHHPSAFRPFVGQIRALVLPLLAPTPSNLPLEHATSEPSERSISETTALRARQVFVLVNGCAPKNAQSQEWAQTLSSVLERTHQTANLVFRALLEDWEPSAQQGRSEDVKNTEFSTIIQSSLDKSGLPQWVGINAGLERLSGLLMTLESYLLYPSTSTLAVPIGKLLDVVDRMTSALPPTAGGSQELSIGSGTNPEIGRQECEAVWTWLPRLHVSALKILEQLMERLENDSMTMDKQILGLILWVFEKEHSQVQIRRVSYRILTQILPRSGSGMSRSEITSLATVLQRACDDLLPTQADASLSTGISNRPAMPASKDTGNVDAYLQTVKAASECSATMTVIRSVSESLLSEALLHLPHSTLPFAVRSKIDKTAVLAHSMIIQQSSVLNPPSSRHGMYQSSIMPLLARQYPHSQGTEALIRPRMSLIRPGGTNHGIDSYHESDEGDVQPALNHPEPFDLGMGKSQVGLEHDKQGHSTIEDHEVERSSMITEQRSHRSAKEAEKSTSSNVPTKRPFESGVEEWDPPPLGQLEDYKNLDEQPLSKRIRDDTRDAYIVSTAESNLPKSFTAPETVETNPTPADATAITAPLAHLGSHTGNLEDDDSDDSSIPIIDPTMDTEDEDEADEDE